MIWCMLCIFNVLVLLMWCMCVLGMGVCCIIVISMFGNDILMLYWNWFVVLVSVLCLCWSLLMYLKFVGFFNVMLVGVGRWFVVLVNLLQVVLWLLVLQIMVLLVVLYVIMGIFQCCVVVLMSIVCVVVLVCCRCVYLSDMLVLLLVEYIFQIGWMQFWKNGFFGVMMVMCIGFIFSFLVIQVVSVVCVLVLELCLWMMILMVLLVSMCIQVLGLNFFVVLFLLVVSVLGK